MFNTIFGLVFMMACFTAGALLAAFVKRRRDKKKADAADETTEATEAAGV